MADATSLRAVADALTIWHELEPQPSIDDGYTDEVAAYLERYRAAAYALAGDAAGDAQALRTAHGPPWDEDGSRPVPLGLLISAAMHVERFR